MTRTLELPYDFDLLYDIKHMSEIENIASGGAHASNATPEDLVNLFVSNKLDVPQCLKAVKQKMDNKQVIWILPNGTWLDYEPLEHEYPLTRKVVIQKFETKHRKNNN